MLTMSLRLSSFSLQVTARVWGGVYGPRLSSPTPTFIIPPSTSLAPMDKWLATVLPTCAPCSGNNVRRELLSALHYNDSFPESGTAVAPPVVSLCSICSLCGTKTKRFQVPFLLPRRFVSSSKIVQFCFFANFFNHYHCFDEYYVDQIITIISI